MEAQRQHLAPRIPVSSAVMIIGRMCAGACSSRLVWVNAGHDVLLASRHPETLADLVSTIISFDVRGRQRRCRRRVCGTAADSARHQPRLGRVHHRTTGQYSRAGASASDAASAARGHRSRRGPLDRSGSTLRDVPQVQLAGKGRRLSPASNFVAGTASRSAHPERAERLVDVGPLVIAGANRAFDD